MIEYWAVPPALMVCAVVFEVMVKVGAGVPVPLSATVCGEPEASSATERAAEKVATEAGVKVTDTVQLEPTANGLSQVLVWPKSAAFVPVTLMPLMLRTALPVFVRVV